jgi:hypothetical protein
VPRWAGNVAVLGGIYVAVMAAAALWMPHEWDWSVFQWLSSRVTPTLSPEVSIVDVDWDPTDVPSNRRRIAAFLDGLVRSDRRPNAVILDVEFDPCQSKPCGESMESARDALVASLRAAASRFPVYAIEQPSVDRDDVERGPLDRQDARIYAAVTGAAQTRFTIVPKSEGLFYRICYANVPFVNEDGAVVGTESVWAMVVRVLMTPRVFASSPACDTSHIPVRIGPKISLTPPAAYRFTETRTFPGYAQFDDKTFVVVGTMKYDRSPFTDRSGPELLAWALSNALDQGSLAGRGSYYDAQPQNLMLLLLVPAFSGLAVVAFMALFYQLKKSRLRGLRQLLPWISAALAAVFGLFVFGAFEFWMLASHHIQPQVSLISLGVVLASALCGFRGFQMTQDEANAIEPLPDESYDYDVFISYAREEGAWVYENVFAPLRDAALPNGKKLSVFFDTSSIRAGTGWQTKLSLAIDGSRFIVPVYSDVYFTKPYCRFEILRAHRKWIEAGDESRCVLPIMRGHPKIYATVNDIQAVSIDDQPDLVHQIVAEIVERLSRQR